MRCHASALLPVTIPTGSNKTSGAARPRSSSRLSMFANQRYGLDLVRTDPGALRGRRTAVKRICRSYGGGGGKAIGRGICFGLEFLNTLAQRLHHFRKLAGPE